jgi:hypothetical protein
MRCGILSCVLHLLWSLSRRLRESRNDLGISEYELHAMHALLKAELQHRGAAISVDTKMTFFA